MHKDGRKDWIIISASNIRMHVGNKAGVGYGALASGCRNPHSLRKSVHPITERRGATRYGTDLEISLPLLNYTRAVQPGRHTPKFNLPERRTGLLCK